ncbi:MAG: hypothetical protein JJU33_08475 [Phycisphaerales bacterium]|nr:hypothetical protein [Phycisphaerales bacterium]
MTYGRARLWLGISAVGTMVALAAVSLILGLPQLLATAFNDSAAAHSLMLAGFLLAYAIVQAPFDLLGGYLLPKRFDRAHPPLGRFVSRLFRGASLHLLLLMLAGIALLLAGRWLGVIGVTATGVLISLVLLVIRKPLACTFAPLCGRGAGRPAAQTACAVPSVKVIRCDDEGFTGGYTGVLRPRTILMPARWLDHLGEQCLASVTDRRSLALQTGAWLRGRVLALAFTWIGIAISALIVGSVRLGTGEGIITFSLWFTLWSFLGLLTLPTPSRAGVIEVDAALRASVGDADSLNETIERLDNLQDREPERPVGIETIFHPIPSARHRIESPLATGRRGYLDAARTAVFLSASGLGLLGRAVHCNCGRPSLWVFLPSD